jgi:hypothetical protein
MPKTEITEHAFGCVRECAPCGNKIKEAFAGMHAGKSLSTPLVPVCDACVDSAATLEELRTAIKVRILSGAYYVAELGKGVLA